MHNELMAADHSAVQLLRNLLRLLLTAHLPVSEHECGRMVR